MTLLDLLDVSSHSDPILRNPALLYLDQQKQIGSGIVSLSVIFDLHSILFHYF